MNNVFQMIGKLLVGFYTAEATVVAGGAVPDKTDLGTLKDASGNSRPVGFIGVIGFTDDANVVTAVQTAALAAYPQNGKHP